MMVDATKHILEDNDESAKDLMAVALDSDDETKANLQILEQDYEDELTATQALNKDIEEAARALVERMDEVDVSVDTAEMPLSEDPEVTAEMSMSEDPEVTAELTAKLPASGDAQNEDFDDSSVIIPELAVDTVETAEMPLPDSDATIEVESGSIDTKKSKAS